MRLLAREGEVRESSHREQCRQLVTLPCRSSRGALVERARPCRITCGSKRASGVTYFVGSIRTKRGACVFHHGCSVSSWREDYGKRSAREGCD
jgi:hypothetical protein